MAPLEPWEKVLVNIEKFAATVHGKQSCTTCHQGDAAASEKDAAHAGVITSPSQQPGEICGTCHADITAGYVNSLHNTMAGYWTALDARSTPENHPPLEEMYGNHCATCHTTCGECHVSQPDNVGGGLFSGHVFEKTPPMTRSCTACHGSRVGNEYLGKNEGLPGDLHFRLERMNCVKCHMPEDIHQTGEAYAQAEPADHRFSGAQTPKCENCHTQVAGGEDGNPMHVVHSENLSCQVCHSVSYSSCDGCHVAISEKTGNPFFETAATYLTFFIGKNTRQSEDRPYEYVTVRHVPIDPQSFAYYGENLLPNFDLAPTWTYATPHNIQLKTPQNESCNACHGNAALFLTADKVAESERAANGGVIVENIPPAMNMP